jgi:hypothetical protein
LSFEVIQKLDEKEYKRHIEQEIVQEVFGRKTTELSNKNSITLHTDDEDFQIPSDFSPTERLDDAWKVIQTLRHKGIYIEFESMTCSVTAFVTNDVTKEKITLDIK